MNSSGHDGTIEQNIVMYHRITGNFLLLWFFVADKARQSIAGPSFFLVNVIIGLLIIFDKDKRGREYRKYLLLTQVLFEICLFS